MTDILVGNVLSTILRHDRKVTSYKIALLRAINDIVLAFPDRGQAARAVAVPLRMLAERWVAYYWPFCDQQMPIRQGQRAQRGGLLREDLSFRLQLTVLRREWETTIRADGRPSDGFYLVNEQHIPRRRAMLPPTVGELYRRTLIAIVNAIQQPIRYAGPGDWSVFARPAPYRDLPDDVLPIPGTQPADRCLVISADLWATFQVMSLWVEALCLHEWALFTEAMTMGVAGGIDRGAAYRLLTDRPDNRRPLTWERNQVDLLLMEGHSFVCPWTSHAITQAGEYALDHLVPISLYPINELWNLVPSDVHFNAHVKRDRLPAPDRLRRALPPLELTYATYGLSPALAFALQQDVAGRFAAIDRTIAFPAAVAQAVAAFMTQFAAARNLQLFS